MAAKAEPCVLHAEVSGSARLHDKLGDAEMLRAVTRCLHRMERAAAGFDGQLLEAIGDTGLVALFNSAEAAHLAACEMRHRVEDLPPVSGVKLAVQIGFGPAPEAGEMPGQSVSEAIRREPARISLRHGGVALALGPDKPEATLGRGPGNDIVIRDPRASRRHASIDRRRDGFVLTDQSSNGTYVSFEGGPEIALKREEVILRGRGHISFGNVCGPETAEIVEFDCSMLEGI